MSVLILVGAVAMLTVVLAPLARRRLIRERSNEQWLRLRLVTRKLAQASERTAESFRGFGVALADARLGVQPEYHARHRASGD